MTNFDPPSQRHIPARWSSTARRVDRAAARAGAGAAAGTAATIWLVLGFVDSFPRWWEICLYTTTSVVTLVMVFILRHGQSREMTALQLKLDELIRSQRSADNAFISLEHAPDDSLHTLARQLDEHSISPGDT